MGSSSSTPTETTPLLEEKRKGSAATSADVVIPIGDEKRPSTQPQLSNYRNSLFARRAEEKKALDAKAVALRVRPYLDGTAGCLGGLCAFLICMGEGGILLLAGLGLYIYNLFQKEDYKTIEIIAGSLALLSIAAIYMCSRGMCSSNETKLAIEEHKQARDNLTLIDLFPEIDGIKDLPAVSQQLIIEYAAPLTRSNSTRNDSSAASSHPQP